MNKFQRIQIVAISLLLIEMAAGWLSTSATAQIFVRPRRPTQTNVKYYDLDWRHIDILKGDEAPDDLNWDVGPTLHNVAPNFPQRQPGTPANGPNPAERARDVPQDATNPYPLPGEIPAPGVKERDLPPYSGGIRLFFYETERANAERAAASLGASYRYLVAAFNFVPRKTFPLFLYNTYLEFLQTNLFPIQEGVLGVTGTRNLEVTLPYFGDHRRFDAVSRHELVHQFTIQKVRYFGQKLQASGDPLGRLPLWLVEGMAEYYTHGFDAESEMLVRDIFLHPDPDRGYVFREFFEDRRFDFLWTYKLGQARCAFLEDTYGPGTLQRILENAPRMNVPEATGRRLAGIQAVFAEVTGDRPDVIAHKFTTWIKRRAFAVFASAPHHPEDLEIANDTKGYVQALAASPDGTLVMYRSLLRDVGRSALYVFDARDRIGSRISVTKDQKPGVESLHPVADRNFDVIDDRLAYVTQWQGRDVIYVHELEREIERGEGEQIREIDLDLGDRIRYDPSSAGVITIDTIALSPDGERVALLGTDPDGQLDLYVMDLDEKAELVQVTDDVFAERDLTWGADSIVYTSNATEHGQFNVFRVSDDLARLERLTTHDDDDFDPAVTADGRVFFLRFDTQGSNLYEISPEGLVKRTGFTTGFIDPTPAVDGDFWALYHYQGRRTPVRIKRDRLMSEPREMGGVAGEATPPPRRALEGATPYNPAAVRNWTPGFVFALLGYAEGGLFGQAFASAHDRLRNHTLLFTMVSRGSLESLDASLFYFNERSRTSWGGGAFQEVTYRVDDTFSDEDLRFISGDRFFGGAGILRYPFNRFLYAQGRLSLGGVDYFLPDVSEAFLADPEVNQTGRNLRDTWLEQNGEMRFQTEASLGIGWNTIRYNMATGPISGNSALLEGTLDVQPFDDEVFGALRFDAEQYFHVYGRSNFLLRTGAGHSFGGLLARQFFLSSFDTLRAVPFGDVDFLLGREFFYSTAEFQFPLDFLIRVALIDLEGIAGVDFGGVGQTPSDIWDNRVLDFATGVNIGLGYFIFRLHFARPINIGAILPNDGRWRTNFSLAYRYW